MTEMNEDFNEKQAERDRESDFRGKFYGIIFRVPRYFKEKFKIG